MRLGNLNYANLKRFEDLEIEDVPFFFNLAFRMIEDVDVVIYTVARARGKTAVDVDTVGEALGLIQAGAPDRPAREDAVSFQEAPEQAFVNAGMVRDVVRAPLPHDDQALVLLSKYVNFQLNNLLIGAARQAQAENLARITLGHYAKFCSELPYPLNHVC